MKMMMTAALVLLALVVGAPPMNLVEAVLIATENNPEMPVPQQVRLFSRTIRASVVKEINTDELLQAKYPKYRIK